MAQFKEDDSIFLAVECRDLKTVENLIQAGIDPNTSDPVSGTSLLAHVAHFGYAEFIKPLVRLGATPNLVMPGGVTAIIVAAYNGHEDCIRTLAELGAKPNIQAENGATAMYVAAQKGYHAVVETLGRFGAKPNIQADNGATAMYVAAEKGYHAVVETLGRLGANPNIPFNDGTTAIYMAARHGHDAAVRALLQLDADPNVFSKDKITPLYIATQVGHEAVVSALLEGGAKPNLQVELGATALNAAVLFDRLSIVKLLLAWGADPSIKMVNGKTTARTLAAINNPAIATLLEEDKINRVSLDILNRVNTLGHPNIVFTDEELINLALELAMVPNPTVRVIDLGQSVITEIVLGMLEDAMQVNNTLKSVIFEGVTLDESFDITKIADVPQVIESINSRIETYNRLEIHNNNISLAWLCRKNFGLFVSPKEEKISTEQVAYLSQ